MPNVGPDFVEGVTFGAFDLLHAGHVLFLQDCKELCDRLTVGLHVDPSMERGEKNKPIQSMLERHVQLSGSAFVDAIIPYETEMDLDTILKIYKFHRRFLDSQYSSVRVSGIDTCEKLGIELCYIPRLHLWSSTELRNRIKDA
jgi:glycerol-3-phosphate cytidylyltransferase